ncbi:MAG: hypothetical protein LUF85_15595 [Bacteroides sp.]|nr:hypothetical protein [Bacteroides sp.]
MEDLFFANVNREDIIRIFGQIKKEEIPLWADMGRHHVMYESEIYPVLLVLVYLYREYHRGETLKRDFEKTEYDGFVWLLRELGFVNMQENFRYTEG